MSACVSYYLLNNYTLNNINNIEETINTFTVEILSLRVFFHKCFNIITKFYYKLIDLVTDK